MVKIPEASFFYSDEDAQYGPTAPERRLYLAVFQSAWNDLSRPGKQRGRAVDWFRGAHAFDPPITFQKFLELFPMNASRMEILNQFIEDSEVPVRRIASRRR